MPTGRCPGRAVAGRAGEGPAAHRWSEDQRWTLARVAELIHRLLGYRYTPRGVSYLLDRLGWSSPSEAEKNTSRQAARPIRAIARSGVLHECGTFD
ncbi:winged helix-turn-helix domain-containing protein [Streptomyces sp. ISL-66]|uniref:helix-turn-helix domain-containing protein n=1 Tax=Streptomyces sp. ISL-66 TaxID=2819186 RepID=UPI0035B29487